VSTMTAQALLAFIAAHNCVSPSLAPVMVGIAMHESKLDPWRIHKNENGTFDVGLAQINSSNFGWLGLTMETALDPCRNLAAGAAVLLARYNGSPPDAVKAKYAAGALAQIQAVDSPGQPAQTSVTETTGAPPPSAECAARPWDTWGQQACRDGAASTTDDTNQQEKKGDQR
jgi:hypothetical protein